MSVPKHLKRQASIDSDAVDEESRRVSLAFSSEEPVDRAFGTEILDHDAASVDLSRLNNSAPLLLNHDPDRQIGVVERAWIDDDDKRGRAVVRFSKSALGTEILNDVVDGVRELVSVSYSVEQWNRSKGKAKEADTLRAVRWSPLEVSIVSIPADATVGVGRSIEPASEPEATPVEPMDTPQVEIKEVPDKRAEKLAQLGRDFNAVNEAVEAIASGTSVDEFTNSLLAKRSVQPAAPKAEVKLDAKERKQYSLLRALRGAAEGKLDGFEREVSDECAKRSGQSVSGFIVPWDALNQKRDLTAGTDAAGGYSVATDLMSARFIDVLRSNTLLDKIGATFMNGLQGDVAIPKQTTAAATEWNSSETDATAQSDLVLNQVTMTPKHLSALTGYSKQLLAQSSLDVEALVRNDLAQSLAIALDAAAINGSGSSGQPTGILNTTGIGSVTSSGSVSHTHLVNLEKALEEDNALVGSLAYCVNPAQKAELKTTEAATNTAVFLLENGEINGFPAHSSNQVPSGNIIFGDWSAVMVGTFGPGLDIVVDPYTQSASRIIRITSSLLVDVAVRTAESFSAITDA